MMADPAFMCQASAAIFSETIGAVIAAPGEHLDGGIPEVDLDPVAVELDLVNPPLARRYLVD
jgi:hypothetical protein